MTLALMGYETASENLVFEEKLSSLRTEVLFVSLALLFLALLAWRVMAGGFGIIAAGLLFLFLLFCFYALNYRVLVIRVLADKLILKFGVFGWTIPISTIEKIYVDQTSLWRIGGAGIHFLIIRGRYRAMFNFLEYERIVVALNEKKGLVREVAFSTKRPGDLVHVFTAIKCRPKAGL
jgi:hypothetical protein